MFNGLCDPGGFEVCLGFENAAGFESFDLGDSVGLVEKILAGEHS